MNVSRETSLIHYVDLLLEANKRTNLVSRRLGRDDLLDLVREFAGTIEAAGAIRPVSVLDIGSGGGLPGIPLAIAHPTAEVILCESRRLRVLELQAFVSELDLRNANVISGLAERLDLAPVGRPLLVTAFGVGQVDNVLPIVAPMIGPRDQALLSIPADAAAYQRSSWLLSASIQNLRAEVLDRILGGRRSVLKLTPMS